MFRDWFAGRSDALQGALREGVVMLEDEEDGVTYVLAMSQADMRNARQLARATRGSVSLPSIGGNAIAVGDIVCISYRHGTGHGTLIVDPMQLHSRLSEALNRWDDPDIDPLNPGVLN